MSIQTIAVVAALVALPVIAQTDPTAERGRQNGAVVMADYDYDALVTTCSLSMQGDQPVLAATIALPSSEAAITGSDIWMKANQDRLVAVKTAQRASAAGMGAGPHVKRGVDFTITPAPDGGMPTVEAMAIDTKGTGAQNGRLLLPAVQKHAINTKGTGTNNGRMAAPGCDAVPSAGPTMTGTMSAAKPVASCVVSDDGMSAMVSVPLAVFGAASKPYHGHVTLMKRGEDMTAMMQDGWSPPVVIAACTTAKGGPKAVGYDLATLKKA